MAQLRDALEKGFSLNILSCLDTFTNYPDVSISGNEEDTNKNVSAKSFSKEDFTPVNRYSIFLKNINYISRK